MGQKQSKKKQTVMKEEPKPQIKLNERVRFVILADDVNDYVECTEHNYEIDQQLSNSINQRIVWIDDKKWEKLNMKVACTLITKWKATKLWLYNNQYPSILKEIHLIAFPALKELNITNNNVESVQEISWIQMPNLEQLYIHTNKISRVRSVRKGGWPSLRDFKFQNNPIEDNLSVTCINTKTIEVLTVDAGTYFTDKRWVAKLQIPKIKKLNISWDKDLNTLNKECMVRKYPSLKL